MRLMRIEYWNPSTGTVRTGSTGHGESFTDMESYLLPLRPSSRPARSDPASCRGSR